MGPWTSDAISARPSNTCRPSIPNEVLELCFYNISFDSGRINVGRPHGGEHKPELDEFGETLRTAYVEILVGRRMMNGATRHLSSATPHNATEPRLLCAGPLFTTGYSLEASRPTVNISASPSIAHIPSPWLPRALHYLLWSLTSSEHKWASLWLRTRAKSQTRTLIDMSLS